MALKLKNLHVVLVEPKNPGNIGAVVRAMKNMGLKNLRLINPVEFRDVGEQKKMGYRSQEITQASREYKTLEQALTDISLVFLATSKKGKWKKDFITPKETAKLISSRIKKEKIAIVFGREDSGVTIDESQMANYYVNIPSAVSYPSLNLSQAVMVLVYEIYQQFVKQETLPVLPKIAPKKSFIRLTDNIWSLMKSLEFREQEKGLFHRSLKRSVNRTRWTNADIAVFDRFCKQVRWYTENHTTFPGGEEK